MSTYRTRVAHLKEVLAANAIDIKLLKKLIFNHGVPHESGLRSVCWKLLLNYLPVDKSEWEPTYKKQRALYTQFIDEMIVKPGSNDSYSESRTDVTFEDHPLNPNPNSQWVAYFRDNEMLVQIDKDCRRLCPDLSFFQSATEFPCVELVHPDAGFDTLRKRVEQSVLKAETVSKNRLGITNMRSSRRSTSDGFVALPAGQEAHWEVVERILFIYAKLNPGQGYVQGMNEIIGPIYYTFASDQDPDVREFAEADAFFCFTALMAQIRDNFIKTLDDSADCGIGYQMKTLMSMLKEKDMSLFLKLEQQDMKPQYYSFRWLTLLLSQEFPLPDVLQLWDSLLADDCRSDFLINVCCAMLILVREELLRGDFPMNMKLLQNYPSTDMQVILSRAVELRH